MASAKAVYPRNWKDALHPQCDCTTPVIRGRIMVPKPMPTVAIPSASPSLRRNHMATEVLEGTSPMPFPPMPKTTPK